jgi:DNA-binding transcriptional LysR family regulator
MEISQLAAITTLADSASLSKTAETLGISEQRISDFIKELELEFGIQLVVDTENRIVLTEAGRKLIEGGRKILRKHADLLNEMSAGFGKDRNRLSIGTASAMFATEQLPEIIRGLNDLFVDTEINVVSGTSHMLVKRIIRCEIDVAFVSLPVENLEIKTEMLFSDEIVAIAHPNHPLAETKYISAATLAGENLILGEKGGNTRRIIDELFEGANLRPNVIMELSRQESIIKMVEKEMGVGLAGAKNVARKIREKRLVSWMVEGAQINWNLGLASLRGASVSPIASEFVRLCKNSFAELEKAFKAEI